jgi:ABC-2 type transport system ATP-binding protein
MTSKPFPVIQLERATLDYGSHRALDGLSLHVTRGSITGLVGRNGAGKSTTIHLLAGLLSASDPRTSIRVLGHALSSDRQAVLQHTGFLLSDPALFPYLTAGETLGFLARAYGVEKQESEKRIRELLKFFELDGSRQPLVVTYSTGMKKRLAIAAALIHAPELLVLDEPFESLDPLLVRALKHLLLEFAAHGGTVLLSSHLLTAVEEICDRVLILDQGRLISAGPVREGEAVARPRAPVGALEERYASLVPSSELPVLDWLTVLRQPPPFSSPIVT